jgi:hypothetical protein
MAFLVIRTCGCVIPFTAHTVTERKDSKESIPPIVVIGVEALCDAGARSSSTGSETEHASCATLAAFTALVAKRVGDFAVERLLQQLAAVPNGPSRSAHNSALLAM